MEKEKKVAPIGLSTKNRRIIIIFTAVFLGLVLLFGIIFGTIALVKRSRAVMSYKGVIADSGVTAYLAMNCKYSFMAGLTKSGIENSDTEYFWNSKAENGKTYGELLRAETESYIKKVIVGTYLFDKHTSLTKDDKAIIKDATEALLLSYGGDKKALNAEAEQLGFDYSDVAKAAEMLYKYHSAKSVIFGYDAQALKSGSFDAECDEFFASYTHAKLLFIRTSDKLVTDPDTGAVSVEDLTDSEREEVEREIERIRYLIGGEGDELMSEAAFGLYISEWAEKDDMNVKGGYYFAPTSSDTAEFGKIYPDVLETVYSMKPYTYTEAVTPFGVCFIYKDDPTPRAYILPSQDRFFTDFYEDAADYIYHTELLRYALDVEVDDTFSELDVVSMPYNFKLIVRL